MLICSTRGVEYFVHSGVCVAVREVASKGFCPSHQQLEKRVCAVEASEGGVKLVGMTPTVGGRMGFVTDAQAPPATFTDFTEPLVSIREATDHDVLTLPLSSTQLISLLPRTTQPPRLSGQVVIYCLMLVDGPKRTLTVTEYVLVGERITNKTNSLEAPFPTLAMLKGDAICDAEGKSRGTLDGDWIPVLIHGSPTASRTKMKEYWTRDTNVVNAIQKTYELIRDPTDV